MKSGRDCLYRVPSCTDFIYYHFYLIIRDMHLARRRPVTHSIRGVDPREALSIPDARGSTTSIYRDPPPTPFTSYVYLAVQP